MRLMKLFLFAFALLALAAGCATYYQRTLKFQALVENGELEEAEKLLDKDTKGKEGKNKVLYLLNKGFLDHLQGEFEESNRSFEQADLLTEDHQKDYRYEALAALSNQEVKPYHPEDFEVVFINYYKALNYLQLGKNQEARVEARRINIQLQALNDRYKKYKNRYTDDAFAHLLMGLIYESNGEVNNAFIAYRNALELFNRDSSGTYFGTALPKQLKRDVLRTAKILGFQSEYNQYLKTFGWEEAPQSAENGELIFLWENGFGPVKSEWSINFSVIKGNGGFVTFANEQYGFNFPFYVGEKKEGEGSSLGDLRLVRVAFPKYLVRKPVYRHAELQLNGERFPLEEVESINTIALQTLEDRFLREMGNSLLRLAVKKAAEAQLRSQNEALGVMATVANAVTEKADTRNWQTLPHAVSYARIPLKSGMNTVSFVKESATGTDTVQFQFEGEPGKMVFFPYRTLATFPPGN